MKILWQKLLILPIYVFDSLNNLNFIRASFTVIGHIVKLQLSKKTHSMKIFATRYEKAAIGFLKKKFACDKEVGIKKNHN